jgi:hypothetical protein
LWFKIFKEAEGLGIDWRVILEQILQKYGERVWMYSTGLRWSPVTFYAN